MAVTTSTIACTVTRIDTQTGPVAGKWVTYTVATPDATTKMGGQVGGATFGKDTFVIYQSAGTYPVVGDTVNIVVG